MSLRAEVARQAFVSGLPTVRLYGVLHELVLTPEGGASGYRMNRVLHGELPLAVAGLVEQTGAPAARFCAWLDLRRGPVLVEVRHDTPVGRSASTTFLDLYADVVGHVPEDPEASRRASLLTGPSWQSEGSTDAVAVLRCATDLCLAVGQCRREHDATGDRAPSRVLAVRPVSGEDDEPLWLPPPVPPVNVCRPPTMAFLKVLDWMLALMPALPGDEELRADLQVIGVASGPGALDAAIAEDLLDGQVTEGLRLGFEDFRRGGRTKHLAR
ncbi:DUF1254 domain-containing protein [Nocardioides pacificus]